MTTEDVSKLKSTQRLIKAVTNSTKVQAMGRSPQAVLAEEFKAVKKHMEERLGKKVTNDDVEWFMKNSV